MAGPDMATNACAAPRILNAEIRMHARLSATLRSYWHALVSFPHWLFGKKHEIEQMVVAQECFVHHAKRVNDNPSASSGEPFSPAYAEFIRTQSQLMETMLKAMILAAGENTDGSAGRNGSTSKR